MTGGGIVGIAVSFTIFAIFAIVFMCYSATAIAIEGYQQTQQTITAQFMRGTTRLFTTTVEIARTTADIERGLMWRRHLAPNAGMLFWFTDERERAFWMRNTLIPLDMVFVNSAGRITNIAHSVPPQNDTLRHSLEPVQYVVELPGGTCRRTGIVADDLLVLNGPE